MGLIDSKRAQRLYDQVASNPKNCKFEDIENLLKAVGFTARNVPGSHVVFKRGELTISVPKRKPVKEVYVKAVLALLD